MGFVIIIVAVLFFFFFGVVIVSYSIRSRKFTLKFSDFFFFPFLSSFYNLL